jgi:HAD superfamily hydrolase (TIGR01509 family)
MAQRRLLLLDLDGTLVDTLPFIIRCYRDAVAPLVTRLPSDEEVVATFGPAEPECIARFLRRCEREHCLHRPVVSEDYVHCAERFYEGYEQGYKSGAVNLYPGMRNVVSTAKERGWYTGIFTGKGRRTTEGTLKHLHLLENFDVLVSADDVNHSKPAPDGVIMAAECVQVAPGDVCFVGDSPADVEAGNAAQAVTIATLWGAFDREKTRRAGADLVMKNVAELEAWVTKS